MRTIRFPDRLYSEMLATHKRQLVEQEFRVEIRTISSEPIDRHRPKFVKKYLK